MTRLSTQPNNDRIHFFRGILFATKKIMDKFADKADIIEIEKINEQMFSEALDLILN